MTGPVAAAGTAPRTGAAPVRLRPVRWWDVAALHRLELRLFPTDAWSVEQFWGELAGVPTTRWYVLAEAADGSDDGAPLGYAGLYAVPPQADVQTLAVAPDAQGRGLGRLLLRALLAEAHRRGCSEVLLEVRADNETAQRLYEAEGFERIAVRPGYYPGGPGEAPLDGLVLRRRTTGDDGERGGGDDRPA
ncbi:MAG: ribosomal protein S18-alanine N-acetyltransferase [Candidatus Nanopelagicales bacterium]